MKRKDYKRKLKEKDEMEKRLSQAKIIAKTPLLPCEDRNKVEQALTNVVNGNPLIESYGGDKYLVVYSEGLQDIMRIFNQFRNRRVLATLRKYLNKYSTNSEIIIYLHKQAAYNGIYSLSEPGESPGREIGVSIQVDNAKEIIRYLTRF